MPETADVAVVGGGVVGCSIAYLLARAGLDVCLLDGGAIGGGATGHGHGVISLVGKDFRPGPHFQLGRRGAQIYPSFVATLMEDGGTDPMYHELPGLSLAIVEEEERIFRDALARLQHDLVLRWIDGAECRAIEPRITREAIGAVLYRHGQIDGYRLAISTTQAFERNRGRMVPREAIGLVREGRRVTGVRHVGGTLACATVVLAMGAWARVAEEWLDFPVPVRPLHGEVLNVELPGDPVRAFILTARHGPILQRRDGVLLVGSIGGVTMSGMDVDARHVFDPYDPTPPVFDLAASEPNGQLMIERAMRVMPALESATLLAHLAGVRPLSADRMPLIGPVPGLDGVLLATGHGTKGIHLAPITAHMVADVILTGQSRQDVPADAFLPARFARGEAAESR